MECKLEKDWNFLVYKTKLFNILLWSSKGVFAHRSIIIILLVGGSDRVYGREYMMKVRLELRLDDAAGCSGTYARSW